MSKAEGVCSVLFRRGVAMEDGRRAKNGSEELMMGVGISSPLSSTQIFFCHFVAFEYIPSGHCWGQNLVERRRVGISAAQCK
jgi:hypothetical protein